MDFAIKITVFVWVSAAHSIHQTAGEDPNNSWLRNETMTTNKEKRIPRKMIGGKKQKNNQTKNKTIGGKSEKHFIGSESHERCAVNSHGFFSKLQVDVNGMFTPRKNACYGHHDSCVRRGHPRFVLIQFQFSMVNIQVDIIFDGFLGFLSHIMDSPLDTPPELQHGFAYGNQSGWGLDISG